MSASTAATRTLDALRARLSNGTLTAEALARDIVERIEAPGGEGARVYIRRNHALVEQARDADRTGHARSGVLGGLPISVKDLFDVAGETTTAGSVALADEPTATRDATVIARLRAAGALFTGRSNMTEFAFSALGLNPHHGTPLCPFDRATRRAPGGSSSGAAVSVSDGMAVAAIGSDTGGSVRVPAALCGLVGFKPTARRIPMDGVFPLAPSVDSIGPIARSVRCCAALDAIMAGEPVPSLRAAELRGLRLLLPIDVALFEVEPAVAQAFDAALKVLERRGASVLRQPLPELLQAAKLVADGGLYAHEAYRHHRALLARFGDRYDPRVRARIERGQRISDATYERLRARRAAWITEVAACIAGADALVMPTVPIIAPPLAPLEQSDALYVATNLRVMQNVRLVNLFDGTAITLPCQAPGQAPVGLMLAGPPMADRRILSIALACERALHDGGLGA